MSRLGMRPNRSFAVGLAGATLLGVMLVGGSAWAQLSCVKAPRANLRAGPGKEFRITWEVNRYMPLLRIDKKGKWVKVKDVDGDTHWVFETLLTTDADCVTISKSRANIRNKPSSRGKKLYTVEKYTSFKLVGKRGKWVKIEFEGKTMWVFHTLIWPPPS